MIENLGAPITEQQVDNLIWELEGTSSATIVKRLVFERNKLKAIVDKLPKTVDGVPIVPGSRAWRCLPSGSLDVREVVSILSKATVSLSDVGAFCGQLYSTREAAEAAREG